MKERVLFAVPKGRFAKIFPEHVLSELIDRYELIDAPAVDVVDEAYIAERVGKAQVIITSWGTPAITAPLLERGSSVALIAHAAGSVKPVVSDAVWRRGVTVTSGAKAIADGVAEFCLGLTLTCSKRAFWYSQQIRAGSWPHGTDVFGPAFEIYRQQVGIIGAGYVGRRFIELLRPFGCNMLLYDPYVTPGEAAKLGVERVDTLEELFSRSRVVSLHAPTTEETKGMIRGSHFALLPEGALFINTARGVIIRQEEMIAELAKGRFIACIDVTDPEPPLLDDPLRMLPNVILTPHEAGCIAENLARIGEFILAEIDAFFAGNTLRGAVTKDRLDMTA